MTMDSRTVGWRSTCLPGRPDDRPRRHDRERCAAVDSRRPRLLPDVARLGGERLPAHVWRLPSPRWAARRSLRPPAAIPDRRVDLHRRLLGCGIATSQEMLIGARAVQGIGGAIASAVALSLLMTLFTEQADRAKAMGVFGFVLSGGGVIGVLAGGILTDLLSWHWISSSTSPSACWSTSSRFGCFRPNMAPPPPAASTSPVRSP